MNLSPDVVVIAELERRFAGIAARAAGADEAAALPAQNWSDVVSSGYLRLLQRGGTTDAVTQVAAMETLARACPSTFWSATMSALVCGRIVAGHAPEPGRLLGGLAGGERLGCFAVVEQGSGSDPAGYTTTVRRAGDAFVISGEKARITNAPAADLGVVFARLADGPHPWCFAFVDLRQPGVDRFAMRPSGLRAMPWGGVRFHDARVAAEDVVPVPFDAFAAEMAWGWLFISVCAVATAQNALDAALDHARRQAAFGTTLAGQPLIRGLLADMHVQVDAARLGLWRAARDRHAGVSTDATIAMLKAHVTETAVRVVEQAVAVHGSAALTRGHPVERFRRDAAMNVIGGFAAHRLREVVAAGLGLPIAAYAPEPPAAGLDADPGRLAW